MPKVINFVSALNTGGVEIMMREWFKRKPENISFDIVASSGGIVEEQLKKMGCKTFIVNPIKKCGIFKYIKQAYRIIKEGKYNIVHAHMGPLSGLIFIASILAGVKVRILHSHGTKFNTDKGKGVARLKFRILKKISVLLATKYIACSLESAEYFFGTNRARKAEIVFNGVDFEKFFLANNTSKGNVVGHIGRFEPVKNHLFLLRVIKKIHEIKSEIELHLLGDGDKREVEKFISENNMATYVKIFSGREDVTSFYNSIDVFVLPSLNEGFPVVSIEAQACGLPCVVSNRITKSIAVTSRVDMVELSEEKWVIKILDALEKGKADVTKELKLKGFGIDESTTKLMNIYFKSLNRGKLDVAKYKN